ncbi:MAG: hypothetical protein HYR88_15315, partial [Verrucomicrobia bacterium]|nr:hypothetical protein [Verrucomicrobiota bacterium]
MNSFRTAFLTALLGASISLQLPLRAAIPAQTIVTSTSSAGSSTSYINEFEFFNNGLYWTDGYGGCSVEFREYGQVGLMG